ncbi:MAG TPA: hypothetical protein VES21_03885, partial [Nocardioidaceae bacterium]|nr:hypothetical protein [Nocardioidaceae bacterium]
DELFAGWRLFLERLAAASPVVMVVEDLQHADVGLLDFLEHVLDWARDVPIFVLTFARPELEERRPGWGAGRRNSTTLSLDPLDEIAMSSLLEGLVPGMPAASKRAIAARAEGIPLYAVETVRMLIDCDAVQPIDGVYRLLGDVGDLAVPATLQSLLAARLDALEPNARAVVADAAVLGGTFPAEALVAVSDQPEAEVRRLLAELVRREVLGVRADPLSPQRGQYTFVQTLFRQVAYDTLSRRDRKVRHLAVATHLRSTFADEGEEIAEVVAAHLIDALTAVPDDPDVPDLRSGAVAMLSRAGDRAVRTGAPSTAAIAYRRAADLLHEQGTAEADLSAAALHERAGAASGTAGDFTASEQHFRAAADAYRRQGEVRAAARADTYVGRALRRHGRLEEARTHIDNALAALREDPDADTVSALAELATLEAFVGNTLEADRQSAAALSEAQALDLPDAIFAELFIIRGIAHGLASRPAQAAASLREAARRAEATRDSAAAARALLNLGDNLVGTDPVAAAEAGRSAVAHSRRIGYRYAMSFAAANLIQALLLTGEWAEARDVYAISHSDDELGDNQTIAQSGAILHALSGDEAALSAVLASVDATASTEDPQDRAATATALAAATYSRGNYTEALQHAQRGIDEGHVLNMRNDAVRWAWPIAADAALALGQESTVEQLIAQIDSYPVGHVASVLRVERQRIWARLLAVRNDPEAAPAFDTATQALRQFGSPYHLAVGLLDQAEYVSEHGNEAAAAELAAEADALASRLGALTLRERAHRLLADVTSPEPRPVQVGPGA